MTDPTSAHAPGVRKHCCQCGKDLTGHTRYRSREGYWCRECNEADQRRRRKAGKQGSGIGWVITLIVLVVLLVAGYLWLG